MRYHPHTERDVTAMLEACGASTVADLFRTIPRELHLARALEIPPALSEPEMLRVLRDRAARPELVSFLGAGSNHHYVPSTVDSILRRSEFYTSYTPYQPEISQGTLQAIFEFQTMVSELFGLPVANASMYDGASALAEAVLMALRLQKGRTRVVIADSVHPDYRRTIATYLSSMDAQIAHAPFSPAGTVELPALGADVACVVVQSPNFFGGIEDLKTLADAAHAAGALFLVSVTDTAALGLLAAPGALGADIVTGEGFSLCGGPSFGGPAVGLFAARAEYLRQMPGRLCGEARDQDGERGYVLTLSTREQHIRREKATSNICTNQGLIALAYSIHLALLGPQGLKQLAEHNLALCTALAERLEKSGFLHFRAPFFNELAVHVPNARAKHAAAVKQGVVAGLLLDRFYPQLENTLLLSVNELHTSADIDRLVEVLQ
jgi:glycine dehydrogenase subunit 1